MTALERLAHDLYQIAGTENPAKIQAAFLARLEAYEAMRFLRLTPTADVLQKILAARWAVEERIFDDQAPAEWDIADPVTRSLVKGLLGAALDAEQEIEILAGTLLCWKDRAEEAERQIAESVTLETT